MIFFGGDELNQEIFPWIDDNIDEREREIYKNRSAADPYIGKSRVDGQAERRQMVKRT